VGPLGEGTISARDLITLGKEEDIQKKSGGEPFRVRRRPLSNYEILKGVGATLRPGNK